MNHWYLRAKRNGYNRNRWIDQDPFVWLYSRYVRLGRYLRGYGLTHWEEEVHQDAGQITWW